MRHISVLVGNLAGLLVAEASMGERVIPTPGPGVPYTQYEQDRRDCARFSEIRDRWREDYNEMMMQKCMATKGYVKVRDGNGYFHYEKKRP